MSTRKLRRYIEQKREISEDHSYTLDALEEIADILDDKISALQDRVAALESTSSTPFADSAARSVQAGDHKSDPDDDDILDELGEIVRGEWVRCDGVREDRGYMCGQADTLLWDIYKTKSGWTGRVDGVYRSNTPGFYSTPAAALNGIIERHGAKIVEELGTIHPAELDDGGGDDEGGPLRDLPEKPPSFARDFRSSPPDTGDDIVVWTKELNSPHFFEGVTASLGFEISGLDGDPVWLPAERCRIDGEPPEAKPEVGRPYSFAGLSGGERQCAPLEAEPVGKWSNSAACWDHTDTDEGDSDDTIDALRGVLDVPWQRTSEEGEGTAYACGLIGELEYRVTRHKDSATEAEALVNGDVVAHLAFHESAASTFEALLAEYGDVIEEAAGRLYPQAAIKGGADDRLCRLCGEPTDGCCGTRIDTTVSDAACAVPLCRSCHLEHGCPRCQEAREQDPHSDLPGDLRNPDGWTPEDGEGNGPEDEDCDGDRRPPSDTPEEGALIEVVPRRPDIPGPTLGRYETRQDVLGYDTEGVVCLPGTVIAWSSARLHWWRYSSLEEGCRE